MKALTLAAAAIVTTAAAASPSQAITFSVGSLAAACYSASLNYNVGQADLDACTRSLDQEPLSYEDRVATFVNRGIVRMNLYDHVGADRDFDTALSLDRNEPEAYLNKGLLRLRESKASEAMPLIQHAIDTHTIRPALALYARGVANEMLGNLKGAYSDLNQAHDMLPEWRLPQQQLARYRVR